MQLQKLPLLIVSPEQKKKEHHPDAGISSINNASKYRRTPTLSPRLVNTRFHHVFLKK
jgi:hypothetical protein